MAPKARRSATVNPAAQALSEAEAAKQQGERRKGLEVQCFQRACDSYETALRLGLEPDEQPEALFGLGWCLQLCADAMRQACHSLPDEAASWGTEAQSRQAAYELYNRAVAAYRQAVGDSGQVREDACINCGNTLCSLAELLTEDPSPSPSSCPAPSASTSTSHLDPATARQAATAFQEAGASYQAALRQEPEDAATWSNLADCLMSYAQLLVEGPQLEEGRGQAAEGSRVCGQAAEGSRVCGQAAEGSRVCGQAAEGSRVCGQALEAYERACSLCDSSQGDDLPGLLCNWGSGLLAAAQMNQEPGTRSALLTQAAARLQHSSSFAHADPEPLIRLAEVHSAAAELEQQQGRGAEAVLLLRRALEEGYSRALTINRSNTEALVGAAETHASLAKLLAPLGEVAAAAQHWASSLQAYSTALQTPAKIGSLSERCSVRFNFACALALHGQEEQAHALLSALVAWRGVSGRELGEDADLAGVRSRPWFQELMARAQAGQATPGGGT